MEIEDITDVLEAEPEVVVIGKGSPGLLKSSASLRVYLAVNQIQLIGKKTSEAVEMFNGLLGRAGKWQPDSISSADFTRWRI